MWKSIRDGDFDVFSPDRKFDTDGVAEDVKYQCRQLHEQSQTLSGNISGPSKTEKPHEKQSSAPEEGHDIPLRPVLIFPGLMSSALKVQKSTIKPSAEGKQLWLNIKAMGFSSLYRGSPLQVNEEVRKRATEITQSSSHELYDHELHEKYMEALEAKSLWLRHLALESDQVTERPGVELKPVEGLAAVDFLIPSGQVARHASWVFGPLIKVMEKVGYTPGENVDAVPYDWRLPPKVLQTRFNYFADTLKKVEDMYQRNNNVPLLLFCHSMGGKACHYFLNYCLESVGQEWLDQHVYGVIFVGAPHLGAPQSLRATIEGDRMGLEAFLSEEEGVFLSRKTGSVNWLHPSELPSYVPPTATVRREGTLRIRLSTITEVNQVFVGRKHIPRRMRVSVLLSDGRILRSSWSKYVEEDRTVTFQETFRFTAPPVLPDGSNSKWKQTLTVHLEEPGRLTTKADEVIQPCCDKWYKHWICAPFRWSVKCIFCPMRCYICCPCKVVETTVTTAGKFALDTVDMVGSYIGTVMTVGATVPISLDTELADTHYSTISTPIINVKDIAEVEKENEDISLSRRKSNLTVSLHYEPYSSASLSEEKCSPICEPAKDVPGLHVSNKIDDSCEYESLSGRSLLLKEGSEANITTTREYYDADPLGPKTVSSSEPPPVQRIMAIYGINVPTEIGGVYRRNDGVEDMTVENSIRTRFSIDKEAELPPTCDYSIENGVVVETHKTPQICQSDGSVIRCSGDGTVPYFSLQQPKAWAGLGRCAVTVHELEGCKHRDILSDKRFYKLLAGYIIAHKEGNDKF